MDEAGVTEGGTGGKVGRLVGAGGKVAVAGIGVAVKVGVAVDKTNGVGVGEVLHATMLIANKIKIGKRDFFIAIEKLQRHQLN
jgi:hypothetical protein